MIDSLSNHQNNEPLCRNHSVQIYSILLIVLDVMLMLLRFSFEIVLSIIKLIVPDKLKDISKEIVLITGTGHGIGRELAIQYCRHGCKVVCVDINEESNIETVRMANDLHLGTAYAFDCDIANSLAVKNLSELVIRDIGYVSVIVNNAGIMPTHSLSKHTDEELFKLFDVNVLSHFWIIQTFMPQMEIQGRGHIIAISSVAGFCGLTNLIPYCSSKYAVRGLMEALHEEIREGPFKSLINTTIVYPYMVDTGLCKKPKMRFPNLMGFLTTSMTANAVINAHRRNIREISIPWSLFYINNIMRCLPPKCGEILKDFMDSGVESDL